MPETSPATCDIGIQVGKPWAEDLVKEKYMETPNDDRELDRLLKGVKKSPWSLGGFLQVLFRSRTGEEPKRSPLHRATVSRFLKGQSDVKAEDIVEFMYSNRDSAPKAARTRTADKPASEKSRSDPKPMARWSLKEWAIQKVERIVDKEAKEISGKKGGLHLSNEEVTWEFIHNFSLGTVMGVAQEKGPTLLRLLAAAAIPFASPKTAIFSLFSKTDETPPFYATYFSRPIFTGSGHNRQDPFVIIMFALILLMAARNLQFSMIRKIFGVWLFSNSASSGIFAVLTRIGLSSSYTSTLQLLRKLSQSAQKMIRQKAKDRAFLLIYDNINRMQRVWDADLGQKDQINNGTAATFIEVEDCDVKLAFDMKALEDAQAKGQREKLDVDVLLRRIDSEKLNSTLALHCLRFLVEEVPSLEVHQDFIDLRFRTTLAIHRMRAGRHTVVHPLATSDFDEGTTEGQRKVFDDLNVAQLQLEKEEVTKLLQILGGDQSSVEKARTLKRFLASCPHGYARYGWVLPLIQLWHMGWADLERVLSTHWGKAAASPEHIGDISSFYFTNTILKGKIKDVKRPDYYPSQRFIFDNLKVEILDCWKVFIGTNNLETHFAQKETSIEELLQLATEMNQKYMSTQAHAHALSGSPSHGFVEGTPWPAPNLDEPTFIGDRVLANTILRMRDSLLHYEFQFAVAEGDIGRAMNVMAVWVFTFTGSGKSKYSNELLELACNFEYEYSDALQEAILNNWLCNLTGLAGCWFPMDLLQEHNIKQLKKMSVRRDAQFGGGFFKEIIAYNIRAFLGAIESVKGTVRLARKGGSHKRKAKPAVMKELATAMKDRELHKLRRGRTLGTNGHVAQDDFERGYLALAEGSKIKQFIRRTLADLGDVNGDEDTGGDIEMSHDGDLPMPTTVMGGSLILGDDIDDIGDELGGEVELDESDVDAMEVDE